MFVEEVSHALAERALGTLEKLLTKIFQGPQVAPGRAGLNSVAVGFLNVEIVAAEIREIFDLGQILESSLRRGRTRQRSRDAAQQIRYDPDSGTRAEEQRRRRRKKLKSALCRGRCDLSVVAVLASGTDTGDRLEDRVHTSQRFLNGAIVNGVVTSRGSLFDPLAKSRDLLLKNRSLRSAGIESGVGGQSQQRGFLLLEPLAIHFFGITHETRGRFRAREARLKRR